jgi:hypothetical protein
MKNMIAEKPPLWWHQNELFQLLETTLGLSNLKEIMKENRILATFANGYGVIINPVMLESGGEIFDLTVMRFYGAGILNHRVAQYLPIPELQRGNFDATIDLCLQVSRLPQRGEQPSPQGTGGPPRAEGLAVRDDYGKRAAFSGGAFH